MDADAIVVGAGAAGLAAARMLAQHALRVVVLEARDRVGGRVWPVSTPRRATPAELGAEFIHGKAPQTIALLREGGSAAIDLGDGGWKQTKRGELEPDVDDFLAAGALFEAARTLEKDENVDAFLRRFAADAKSQKLVRTALDFVEGFEAADPAIASARAIAEEWHSGVDSTSSRPFGGYAPLIELLRLQCTNAGVDLSLETVVRRIVWRRNHVAIDTLDASGDSQTFRSRAAIVTLPLGVLQAGGVAFEPALPQAKLEALRGLAMGHATKAVLVFRTAFWEELHAGRYRDGAFFRTDAGEFRVYWTQLPVRSELVTAWIGGPRTAGLQGLPPEEVVERALRGFGDMLGEPQAARREFETGFAHDWQSDPFARGAYSYVIAGANDARASLGTPLDETIFFAGEATSTNGHGGTVNGALETGERAAQEVLDG